MRVPPQKSTPPDYVREIGCLNEARVEFLAAVMYYEQIERGLGVDQSLCISVAARNIRGPLIHSHWCGTSGRGDDDDVARPMFDRARQ